MLKELLIAFGMAGVCLILHTVGIVMLAEWLVKRGAVRERRLEMRQYTLLLILVFAVILLLHTAQATLWALFFYLRDLFPDFETALYFSLVSYTTIGYGDVVLPQKWRLLGGIEGISGALLSGLSTAFLFVMLSRFFQDRLRQLSKRKKKKAARTEPVTSETA
jgi:voltage-gated potassium channel Kch